MKLSSLVLRSVLAAACTLAAVPCFADWTVSTELGSVKPAPENMAIQVQNPPSFTWSRYPTATAATSYVLEVKLGTDTPVQFTTNRNWYLPAKALANGTYTWRVRTADSTNWSTPRSFVIDATSVKFEVPDNATLRATVLAHGRARSLPKVFPLYSAWTPAMVAERGAAYKALTDDVTWHIPLAAVKDSDWTLTSTSLAVAAFATQIADVRNRIGLVSHQLEAATLLYRLNGDSKTLDEALLRGDQLAALNPAGPTSFVNQDQGSRQIASSLIKAIDMLGTKLDATRRAKWLAIVATRTTDIYNDLAGSNGRLDQYPFDSHGGTNLGFLALIATLSIGDIPAANDWFDFSVRAYIHSVYAWSGPEGGYGNGSAYGEYAVDYTLRTWDQLSEATGVNLYKKPWSKGFSDFFAEFVPPGSKTHVFGDAHDTKPNMSLIRAYASRFSSPAAKWYYNNSTGVEDPLTLLVTPSPLPVNTNSLVVAAPPPNAAFYPSIGWVAMHSNLADLLRTSLYFKSSPFGSYSHSHGDQNGIVLSSGGRQLLLESGYYEYGTAYALDWYRQTKAHNAITYDNGVGQKIDGNTINLTRNGKITSFSTSTDLDFAEGDATPAYEGALTSSVRKVWYLRKINAFVVLDKLVSPAAHAFEWNMHTAVPIVKNADGSVTVTNVDRSVCIKSLSAGATFATRTGPATKTGVFEGHGAFVRPSATTAEFLMLLDVGCKNPTTSLATTTTGRTLTVGTQTINLPK